MKEQQLQKKIAKLESINDQLLAEFNYLESLLKELGFDKGVKTLKEAANELIERRKEEEPED